jgi:hypothetical protein
MLAATFPKKMGSPTDLLFYPFVYPFIYPFV